MVYDYIFCGFGLSALVVLDELLETPFFERKNVLILDQYPFNKIEKTWCFWEQGSGKWDVALTKKWKTAIFKNNDGFVNCLNDDLQYKMLDSEKLFAYIHAKIATCSNITRHYEKVLAINQLVDSARVVTENTVYEGRYIFNSIVDKSILQKSKHPLLLQHFLGWYVKTEQSAFLPDTAILMDFAIDQKDSTRFMYVLPLSDFEFLLEFTLFSPSLLEESEYETELKAYLAKNGIVNYEITKKESGIIPMTAHPFWKQNTANVLYIGAAGGWTKSSTGYTFNMARTKARKLREFLGNENIDFREFHKPNRFYLYDRLFVSVLFSRNNIGYELFSRLFLKSDPSAVLRFLDEKSTLSEEIKIILACPKKPFLKALGRLIFKFAS